MADLVRGDGGGFLAGSLVAVFAVFGIYGFDHGPLETSYAAHTMLLRAASAGTLFAIASAHG